MLLNVWLVASREVRAIFSQPLAYIYTAAIITFAGFFFAVNLVGSITVQGSAPSDMGIVFNIITFLSLFGAPVLTMRLLAEESRSGTIELLMTLPVRDGEVVWGKFLAGLVAYLAPLVLSLVYLLFLLSRGNPDLGVVFTSFLGTLLWGFGLIGIGTLASALTDSQMSAWLLATGAILLLYLVELPVQTGVLDAPLSTILTEISYQSHQDGFLRGLITAKDVLYYLLVGLVANFAATRVMESRRWR